jgi:hypothetical protein
MRMRKLGSDHSVVFLAPEEVIRRIRVFRGAGLETTTIDSSDVLAWTMSETCKQLQDNLPLWADQGLNYTARQEATDGYERGEIKISEFLSTIQEPEARSLKELYDIASRHPDPFFEVELEDESQRGTIRERCLKYGVISTKASQVQEEQERELAHEKEVERQVERSQGASAEPHSFMAEIERFMTTGVFRKASSAFVSLSECLRHTGTQGPRSWDIDFEIVATADFARTIKLPAQKNGAMDDFLRPVRWILSSGIYLKLVLISPFEANILLPRMNTSHNTYMHMYAPRASRTVMSFDDLDFLTVPRKRNSPIPRRVIHHLNLFSGQLFLASYKEYTEMQSLVTTGFGRNHGDVFKKLFGYRRKGEGFLLTHMGQLLRGRELQKEDFRSSNDVEEGVE